MLANLPLTASAYTEEGCVDEYDHPPVFSYGGPFSILNGLNSLFWERIRTARARFQAGVDAPFDHIRPPILRSWQRSRAAGAPHVGVPMVLLKFEEFQRILKKNDFLVNTARQIMEELLENIRPAKNCIILTDTDGVYLHTVGDGEGFGRGSSCPLRGLVSREAIEGTTSMGICLVEQEPTYVLGCEHYNPHFDGWACAAAPVFDLEDTFVGTLSLTIERDKFHQHTFGLIVAAAKAIGEQLRLRRLLQEIQTIMEILGEAVVVLDANGRLRLMNRYAKRLFHVDGEVVGRDFVEIATEAGESRLLVPGNKVRDGECAMRLADGSRLTCLFSASPTPEGGLCVTLRESRRMHALANRMTGAKAVYDFSDIKGDSEPMRQAVRLAQMASQHAMTTLILGESGVGKELFAQAIHNAGPRRGQPFIVVNCGAIPRDLVQSELFGYEPGAFTGAGSRGMPGKFELADGGTIFLDEIGDMPLAAQTTLLRVLQEGEVTRLGGKRPCRVDVRVVAATHRDLAAAVEDGTFRRDLYYRLNVLVIDVPSLRDRPEDIGVLADFFLDKIARGLNKSLLGFTPEARRCLEGAAWPGNVRELEHLVERAAVMADGPRIGWEDLPAEYRAASAAVRPGRPVPAAVPMAASPDTEARRLTQALLAANGNVRAAAKALGISRVTLYARLRRHGLCLDDYRQSTP